MFQKLYKHLEVMNDSLREQESHNTRYETAAHQISGQLELVNAALLDQNQLLDSQGSLTKEALLQNRRGLTPILQLINLVLCCIGIVAITYFCFYTYRLSKITEQVVSRSAGNAQSSQPVRSSSLGQANSPSGQIDGSGERQIAVEQHLAKLDSLIGEQAQSIKELKKLNIVAVRTFNHIKKHFDSNDSASVTFTRR